MYSGLQPAITALIATFSAVMDTARFVMNAICCCGPSRAASSIAPTRSGVGGTTGRPSVQPCWKQNSIASPTSWTWYRFDVSETAIYASSRRGPSHARALMAPQYSAAAASAPSAGQREQKRRADGDRRRPQRLLERPKKADRRAARSDQFAQERHPGDHPEGAGEEREAPGGALTPRRKRRHDRGHVGNLEEAEPEPGHEERRRDEPERCRSVHEAEEAEPRGLHDEPRDRRRRCADAIGDPSSHGRCDRRPERRQHEEDAAHRRAETARVDEIEGHEEPDGEDRAARDEGQHARPQHTAAGQIVDRDGPALTHHRCGGGERGPYENAEREGHAGVEDGAPAATGDQEPGDERPQCAQPHRPVQEPEAPAANLAWRAGGDE